MENRLGSNGVVSIRVEALGVSITIADGSIAIRQTKTEIVDTALKVEGPTAASRQALPAAQPPLANGAFPASDVVTEGVLPLSEDVDDSTISGDSGVGNSASVIDAPRRLSNDAHVQRLPPTKPAWSDEEVEKLKALWPTHSASAIAEQLGRGRNAVRSKIQNLGLKKAAPPTATAKPSSREAKPAPKPKPLSAAVTEDPLPARAALSGWQPGLRDSGAALRAVPDDFSAVALLDHRPGQCRWIISDGVWPVMYCGAPVVDSSSWCEQHFRRVFRW
jgi:hypothetical protein